MDAANAKTAQPAAARVVHVVAADLAPAQAAALDCIRSDVTDVEHRVVQVGSGATCRTDLRSINRVHALPPRAWTGPWRLSTWLANQPRCDLLHAWTPTAARWCRGQSEQRPLVIDVEDGLSPSGALQWPATGRRAALPHYVCRTTTGQDDLLHRGVRPDHIRQIQACALPARAPETQGRAALREAAGWPPDARVVALVPPLVRETATFLAAWATLLARKLAPHVHLLPVGSGPDRRRVAALVAACHMRDTLLTPPRPWGLHAALAAADVAVCLPRNEHVPLFGLATAVATRLPLITTPTRAVRELLYGAHVTWCPSRAPRDIARQIARTLTNLEPARAQAERSAAALQQALHADRLVSGYAALYATLARP